MIFMRRMVKTVSNFPVTQGPIDILAISKDKKTLLVGRKVRKGRVSTIMSLVKFKRLYGVYKR